ncbi:hypothetical protein SLA2020_323620 [Shorea laevis]
MSGEASYGYFVLLFDFKDWKIMPDVVPLDEEVMPHRKVSQTVSSQTQPQNSQRFTTTLIKKSSKNASLTYEEDTSVEDSPETDGATQKLAIRSCRRKIK